MCLKTSPWYQRFSYGHFLNQGWVSGQPVVKSPPWMAVSPEAREAYGRWRVAAEAEHAARQELFAVALASAHVHAAQVPAPAAKSHAAQVPAPAAKSMPGQTAAPGAASSSTSGQSAAQAPTRLQP